MKHYKRRYISPFCFVKSAFFHAQLLWINTIDKRVEMCDNCSMDKWAKCARKFSEKGNFDMKILKRSLAALSAAAVAAAAAAAAEMRIRGHRVVRQEAKAGTHLQPVLLISLFVKTEATKY